MTRCHSRAERYAQLRAEGHGTWTIKAMVEREELVDAIENITDISDVRDVLKSLLAVMQVHVR